jgi:hypothetical protein
MLGQEYFTANPIVEYDKLQAACIVGYKSLPATYNEDPDKAAEVIVDVVRGEGLRREGLGLNIFSWAKVQKLLSKEMLKGS